MATTIAIDQPGKVVYELRSGDYPHLARPVAHLGYEVEADLSNSPVLMWARVTDQEDRPGGRVRPLVGVTVPTFSRATLDSLARALDNGRRVRVTVEWPE